MAGTLFGLPLSQPISLNGRPEVGCKLYIYTAGTFTSPVTAYKDNTLTVGQEHPFPIPSDGWGRLPIFWLADGSYAFRLVDAAGVVLASSLNVLALGPSAGGGGGGPSIDTTALAQTGDVLWQDVSGTRAGYVRDNGRTIGSATSGATERASSDVAALYAFLWQTYSDSICPVTGGRGASAADDFSANKAITLPDKRGYVPGGLDDMGNAAASRYSGVPVVSGNTTTPGSILGEASGALSQANLPSVMLNTTIPAGQGIHSHGGVRGSNNVPVGGDVQTGTAIGTDADTTDGATLPQMSGTTPLGGSGTAVNKVQKTVLGTFYRKL